MRALLGVLLVLSLAACDRGSSKAAAPSCDADADAIMKTVKLPADKATTGRAVVLSHCKDDKWSEDARSCFAKASTSKEQKDCSYKTLTREQAESLKKAIPSSFDASDAMAKMNEFADKMCACKDTHCAQGVSDEMTKWAQDMAKNEQEPPKMSDEDQKKAVEIGTRMGDCMQNAMSAEMRGNDHDAM
jgi:hypothetical protein